MGRQADRQDVVRDRKWVGRYQSDGHSVGKWVNEWVGREVGR